MVNATRLAVQGQVNDIVLLVRLGVRHLPLDSAARFRVLHATATRLVDRHASAILDVEEERHGWIVDSHGA